MKELSINYEDMAWSEATGYPTGAKIKLLRKDGSARTFLLKLPPGFDMEAHSHIATEQHFVLKGQYTSNDKKFGVGYYRLIPSKSDHGPFTTENGAVVLVVWDSME
jgi:anti-sigma factor ChrR (cupin superfamily)